jgi:site-specific DNA recombinase
VVTVVYCRISADQEGQALGVKRQENACRELCLQLGFDVATVYTDNDISASTLTKRPRPQYEAMLAAVRAGDVNRVVAYSASRLTRRPAEWIVLIDLAREGRLDIKTVVSGPYDNLNAADGRAVALTVAAWDAAEAERTSERVKAAARQRAERGLPKRGRYRTFGYTDDFSEVVEGEADEIRDAFKRAILGESLHSIAQDWRGRGVSMGNGKEVHFSTVQNVLRRHLYAGIATHKGEVVGKMQLEPIINEATFYAAKAALDERAQGPKRSRRYLLSGMPICDRCLRPMFGGPGHRRKDGTHDYRYYCKTVNLGCGKVSVVGWKLDAMVLVMVRQRLIVRGNPISATLAQPDYQAEIDRLDSEIAQVHEARAGGLEVGEAIKLINGLSQQKKQLLQEEAKNVAVEVSAFQGWDDFKDASLSQRRAIVRTAVSRIIVRAADGKQWSDDRITLFTPSGNEVPASSLRYGRYERLVKSLHGRPKSPMSVI